MENREDLLGLKEETRWVGSGYACKREMGDLVMECSVN